MTLQEFVKVFTKICIAFNQPVQEAQVVIYYEYLNKYDLKSFARAANNLIRSLRFLPKVAEIIDEIRNLPKEASNCVQLENKEIMPTSAEVKKIIKELLESLDMGRVEI